MVRKGHVDSLFKSPSHGLVQIPRLNIATIIKKESEVLNAHMLLTLLVVPRTITSFS